MYGEESSHALPRAAPMLDGIRILVVENEPAIREVLRDFLSTEGASIVAVETGAAALQACASVKPDIVIVDFVLPDTTGARLIDALRAAGATCPAIAIAARGQRQVGVATPEQFHKVLHEPFALSDLVVAVASLADLADPTDRLRSLLRDANRRTDFRFTSLFRFDGEALTSVWSYDRDNPTGDQFPTGVDVEGSYCVFVRANGGPFVVEDALDDPRVAAHPKKDQLRAYCGVPVRDGAGRVIGSLCHFDERPRSVAPEVVTELAAEARRFETGLLAKLARRPSRRIG